MAIDATKPADDDFVVDWPAYIRAIATLVNANEAAIGGEYKPDVTAQNVSGTISTFNQVVTVNASGAVTLTLGEVVVANVGDFLEVHKLGVGNLTITAGGSDTIADGAAGTSIVNSTAAEAKAANIILRCVAAGQWMLHSMLGTWA
jgi:hypothetical protein